MGWFIRVLAILSCLAWLLYGVSLFTPFSVTLRDRSTPRTYDDHDNSIAGRFDRDRLVVEGGMLSMAHDGFTERITALEGFVERTRLDAWVASVSEEEGFERYDPLPDGTWQLFDNVLTTTVRIRLWPIAAVTAMPVLVTLAIRRRRIRMRIASGCCVVCGFDLRGTPDGGCSECGAARA